MAQTPNTAKKSFRLTPLIFLAILLIWLGIRLIAPDSLSLFAGSRPDYLGVTEDKLAPCPVTPNCVSSQSQDAGHLIEPLSYQGSGQEAIDRLAKIITSQPRTKIIKQESNYLYSEFSSQWMGFVDDVEFCLNPSKNVLEVRSASRLGESDLNANRQRVETIRKLFSVISE
jgi:uncharacterized protein (DUF1499 family)